MTADRNDQDEATETSVDVDTSSIAESTLTATGVTLTGEALAAAANAGLLPADAEPSTVEARLVLPADSEPSTIEPTLGIRGLAGAAVGATVVAGPSPSSSDDETGPGELRPVAEDDEERTTLNIESRLLGTSDQARQPPPVKHLPSTSTTPKRKLSKSPTIKGIGVPLAPTIERQHAPSDPTLDDEHNDETIDRPPPSRATKKQTKEAASPVQEPIGGDDVDEQTATSTRRVLGAVEVDDADTSIDASVLAGGLSLAAVADAASGFEGEGEDEIPTSVRLEAAPPTMLSSSDLVTDAGPVPISDEQEIENDERSPSAALRAARQRALAMAQLPTAPAPFAISGHVRVDARPPEPLEPLEPRGPKGTVKIIADGTGSTPIAHADLPGRWPPAPFAAEPTTPAERPRRRGLTVVLLAALACLGTVVFLKLVPSKTALVATAGAPTASSDSPPPQSASASATIATAATAEPQPVPEPPTATAAPPATAPSAPEPAKTRVAPPHKPPPAWRPPARPTPAAPAPAPAPKGSSFTPLHI